MGSPATVHVSFCVLRGRKAVGKKKKKEDAYEVIYDRENCRRLIYRRDWRVELF
jgi:hypothetical protein